MKIFWENSDWPGSVIYSGITCLSWISTSTGRESGLLATGSDTGAVAITVTNAVPVLDDFKRTNYNLRGHHSAVSIVAWNREELKLASCDSSGIIYVWVPNEERWSVELVNDRGIKVRCVGWSRCGETALICYEDNFVLIGSSTGQRIWSSSFATTVTCGVWAPDSSEIILGFSSGVFQVLTRQGGAVTERTITNDSIHLLAASPIREDNKWTLAVCSSTGLLHLLEAYDEVDYIRWQSEEPLESIHWNANGTLLAVVLKENRLVILTYNGNVVYSRQPPIASSTGLTAFTWAHNDRIIVAGTGGRLAIGRIVQGVPALLNLVTYSVWQRLASSSRNVDALPLPSRQRDSIKEYDHHIIRCRVPSKEELLSKICEPSDWRWYCTIRPVSRKAHTYVLCMEHMSGLLPLLVGKQTNRIIPQFYISMFSHTPPSPVNDNGSSAQVEDVGCGVLYPPSMQRSSVWRRSKRQLRALMNRHVTNRSVNVKANKLVQITSNVWCTRFKMSSLDTNILPPFLAQVVYKTSVLHLQPRQMTVHLADLAFKRTMSPYSTRSRRLACGYGRNTTVASSSDSAFSNNSSLREVPVVPADRDPLLHQLHEDGPPEDGSEEPLSLAEKMLFQNVLTEFGELRIAVEKHIARMKYFASDLERSSQRLDSLGNSTLTSTNHTRGTSRIPVLTSKDDCLTAGILRSQKIERTTVEPSTSSAFWFRQFDDIEYIDDDDSSLLRTCTERTPLMEYAKNAETARKGARQLNDITSVLDKLSKLANDLTTRCAVGQLTNDTSPLNVHYNGSYASTNICSESGATVSSLRSQLKDISRRVSQIEKKISYGDELLDDVCGDLQQRIQHIKNVLGEQPAVEEVTTPFLTMNNKAPFWNEASQVYQLDFGGRVTQESAKNFQIEYNERQVMQFGRIENGAYTLDFREPFSAVQAFSIALASITQRLK